MSRQTTAGNGFSIQSDPLRAVGKLLHHRPHPATNGYNRERIIGNHADTIGYGHPDYPTKSE